MRWRRMERRQRMSKWRRGLSCALFIVPLFRLSKAKVKLAVCFSIFWSGTNWSRMSPVVGRTAWSARDGLQAQRTGEEGWNWGAEREVCTKRSFGDKKNLTEDFRLHKAEVKVSVCLIFLIPLREDQLKSLLDLRNPRCRRHHWSRA